MHLHMTTKALVVQECIKERDLFLKESSEKKKLQKGTKVPGMKVDSMVIVIFVLTLVIKLWIVDDDDGDSLQKCHLELQQHA